MQNNMIDFVFVVDKPKHWHHMNLQRNPDHYSALRHLGAERIVKIQEMGAGVYYNTLVRCEDKVRQHPSQVSKYQYCGRLLCI